MTEYFIALDLPLDEDLADFSALLWQQGVAHHIAEEGNRQLLRVGDAQQQEQVRALYSRLKTGELHIERRSAPTRSAPVLQRRSGPVVWVLLLLSIAGALLPQLDRSFESVALLTFYPLDLESGQLLAQWPVGEPWRLLTPMFLHFGLMHIAFNGLWLWELGGMIERRQGGMALLGLVLLTTGIVLKLHRRRQVAVA